MIVEDVATKSPLQTNTLGENILLIWNRIYYPLKIREMTQAPGTNGLMGILRMVNAHKSDSFRPLDCVDIDVLSYLAELIAVLGNRYLRNISILHDQERATHGFSTDLLTIRMASELNLRHAEHISKLAEQSLLISSAQMAPTVAGEPASRKALAPFESIYKSAFQIQSRCRDMLSIQDHMAEQVLQVLQTKDNFFIQHTRADSDTCVSPYKTVFLRLLGAKAGLAKMFNRQDITITSNRQSRFDDEFKRIPSLSITNSGMYTIARNLTENAIKYSVPDEPATLDVIWTREGNVIHFDFRDTGIGISSRDEEKLFAEGFRGLEAQRLQLRGNGIGLFLSRELALRFNGDLKYIRPPSHERGSIFRLSVRVNGV